MADERRDGSGPSAAELNKTHEVPAARAACADTERVLEHLAEQPTPSDVPAALPEPTWEDVRIVMARDDTQGRSLTSETRTQTSASAFVTPQAFYAEAMRRAEVREILRRLAE